MLSYGYGGSILRIDLTERRYRIEKLDPSWIKPVIGGRAANTKRLVEELDPDCDPLDPENILIYGVGPLTGSLLPASAYFMVSAKSPLTGLIGTSAAGGQFAAEMKLTGFDQIIITGRSDRLLYLLVTESGAEFVECSELAGKMITETTEAIRREHYDYNIQVAAIGQAGENRVLFSTIVSSGNRVNGQTGMGCVMGSKNLKAVAVRGTKSVEVADPLSFLAEVGKIESHILKHKEYRKRYRMGTTMLMSDLNGKGILPINHYREGNCPYIDEISGQTLARYYKVKNKACFNCNLHCSRYTVTNDWEAEGPEFGTLCGFTSRIGNRSLPFALEMNRTLNQMGLDSGMTSEIIGWIMACQEQGFIHPDDLDGFRISWGETDKIRELVDMIVNRRGIGDWMAEGTAGLLKNFSEEARSLLMHVKRPGKSCGAMGEIETYSKKMALLVDCLTICKTIGYNMDGLNIEKASILLKAGTGLTYSPQYLEEILEEDLEREHRLNQI